MKARDDGRVLPGIPGDRGAPAMDPDEASLRVAVHEGCCGAVEVRVLGPSAGLRLVFDPAETPAYIRHVVDDSVERYRGALGLASAQPGLPPEGVVRLHPSSTSTFGEEMTMTTGRRRLSAHPAIGMSRSRSPPKPDCR